MRLLPEASIFVIKASDGYAEEPPAWLPNMGETVGKSVEIAAPVIYAFPEASTAISKAPSKSLPPRYVE